MKNLLKVVSVVALTCLIIVASPTPAASPGGPTSREVAVSRLARDRRQSAQVQRYINGLIWRNTVHWNNVVLWNETVAENERQAEEARRAAEAVEEAEETVPTSPSPDYSSGGSVWDSLAACESGGNWAANTGNGYFGGIQFSMSSWQAVGGTGYPHENSRETQIAMGERLRASGGWGHWPGCARKLGLI